MTEKIHPEQQAAEDAAEARAKEAEKQAKLAEGREQYRASVAKVIATQVATVREQVSSVAPSDGDRTRRASQADVLEASMAQTANTSLAVLQLALKLDAVLELAVALVPQERQATVRERTRGLLAIVEEEIQKVSPGDLYG